MGVNVTQMGGGGKKIAESTATMVTDVPASKVISAKGLQKGSYDGQSKILLPYAKIASAVRLTADKIVKGNTILGVTGNSECKKKITLITKIGDKFSNINKTCPGCAFSTNRDSTNFPYLNIGYYTTALTANDSDKKFIYGIEKKISIPYNCKITMVIDNNYYYLFLNDIIFDYMKRSKPGYNEFWFGAYGSDGYLIATTKGYAISFVISFDDSKITNFGIRINGSETSINKNITTIFEYVG